MLALVIASSAELQTISPTLSLISSSTRSRPANRGAPGSMERLSS
jgi:hypothetical protein